MTDEAMKPIWLAEHDRDNDDPQVAPRRTPTGTFRDIRIYFAAFLGRFPNSERFEDVDLSDASGGGKAALPLQSHLGCVAGWFFFGYVRRSRT